MNRTGEIDPATKRSGTVIILIVLAVLLLGGAGFLFYWFRMGEPAKGYYEAAKQGDAEAQYQLGECYYNGNGVRKDFFAAADWYRKAAEQGHADAQFMFGRCCYHGEGISKDYGVAFEYYRKAAEQDHAKGQCGLGYCYYDGEGVEENKEEAVKWYRKAAEQGIPEAQNQLAVCLVCYILCHHCNFPFPRMGPSARRRKRKKLQNRVTCAMVKRLDSAASR